MARVPLLGGARDRGWVALAVVCVLGAAGCDTGSPASPAFEGGLGALTVDAGGAGEGGGTYAVCPPDMDASFGSIYAQMLVPNATCGTTTQFNCHSASGAAPTGTGNLLDFSVDAAAVYEQLLGDGGGHASTNLSGSVHNVLRVVPGDASASYLYIKLMLTTAADPQYGAGMPLTAPGSVCPAALEAVKAWIDQGAPRN
jgi:hypothetical protein